MRAIVTGGAGLHRLARGRGAARARGRGARASTTCRRASARTCRPGATLHVEDIREPLDAIFDDVRPERVLPPRRAGERDRVGRRAGARRRGQRARHRCASLEAARRARHARRLRSTGGAIYGECDEPAGEDLRAAAALAVRHVEALRRGVPAGVRPAARHERTRSCATRTSTARARTRTARPAWSRSSSTGSPPASGRGSSATAATCATTSTSATSRGPRSRRRAGAPGIYNIGTGVATTDVELAAALRGGGGRRRRAGVRAVARGRPARSVLDVVARGARAGLAAGASLADGLAETWAGYV